MTGLDLAKNSLQLGECKVFSERLECSTEELETLAREKISDGIFVAWQVQSIVWGKFDGEKFLLKDNLPPHFEDWLEFRLFNEREELHLKWAGKNFVGRYVRDNDDCGEEKFFVDSFARFWGECATSADGWTTLLDAPRKISMVIPCADGGKFYGLTTRNYIGNDEATGLSGYVDYRFVKIDSAWDGD